MFQCSTLQTSCYKCLPLLLGRETDCSLYRECCLSVFVPCFNVQNCRLPVTSVCPYYWVEKLTAPFTENVVSLCICSMFQCSTLQTSCYKCLPLLLGRETDCSLYRECCLSVFVPCFNVQHCRLPVTSVCPFYWVEKLTAPFTENVVSLYLFHVSMFNTADFLLQVSAPTTG